MRGVLIFYLIAAAGIFGFAAGTGITGSLIAAIPIALLFALATGFILFKYPIITIDKTASSRGLQIVSIIATVIGLIQLSRLLVFIIAPSQAAFSTIPSSEWETRHSCFSAYYVAAQSARKVPDIYANSLYSLADDDPAQQRKPQMIGPLRVDVFEYPPTFLLVPEVVNQVTPDFFRARMLWFALNGIVVILAMLLVARELGPIAGTRALLLAPLVWFSLIFLSTMQKGNVQMAIIAISMIAMVLFAKKRFFSGGTLLAYATASKLYPGMLIVYLMMRRQWRAVIYTAALGFGVAFLALIVEGWQTYSAFLAHLPGILSGEAFPAFRNPSAMAINYSIPGIIFKLKIFGIGDMGFGASKIVGWIYTLVLLAIIVMIAKRKDREEDNPLIWLSILILATLRSPFLPQAYAGFPPLWLLTLVAALHPPTTKNLILTILTWIGLNLMIPIDWGFTPKQLALISAIPQILTVVIAFVALRQPNARVRNEIMDDSTAINQTAE
jgi:hypothetical protein